MTHHNIIVIGASAGGIPALNRIVRELPASLPAAVLVVVHVPALYPSSLPAILTREGQLPAHHAQNGERILPGHIYVAPPDHHLLVQDGCLQLSHGPMENRARPAIDPLFRSAARAFQSRVVGVVLSGALYDGAAGLVAVKRYGGVGIVQDPAEAQHASMPRTAIAQDEPDYILPVSQVAATLIGLTQSGAEHPASPARS